MHTHTLTCACADMLTERNSQFSGYAQKVCLLSPLFDDKEGQYTFLTLQAK